MDTFEEHTISVMDSLNNPDPDPEMLPMLVPADALALQEETALHLCRASISLDDSIEKWTERRKKEIAAWDAQIARLQEKRDSFRTILRDWMVRSGVTKLQHPLFTASITKGREKLTWTEEDRLIGILDAMGASEAIKVTRSVIKKALEPIYNAVPGKFEGVVLAEQGEPTLRILKKE